jgi:GntR family transcriptional regulator
VTMLSSPDAETGIPRYRQIADQLAELILQTGPGVRLPSEHELAGHLGVSRSTAIQALRDLEQRGLVLRQQGRGSFSADPRRAIRSVASGRLPSFSQDLRSAGRTTQETVVECDRVAPSAAIALALGVEGEGSTWCVVRLIRSDGEVVVRVTSHLPCHLYPDLDPDAIESSSLYQYLEAAYGKAGRPSSADEQWSAQAAEDEVASVLGIRPGAPIMRVERLAYLSDGTAAEHSDSSVRGESFAVSLHVTGIDDGDGATPDSPAR